MPISIEADSTLAQGYIKVNGTTAATVTSTGLTTASLQNSAVTGAKLADGMVVQVVHASTNATTDISANIPSDDTIPQNTEGTEVLTAAITPKSATNKILIAIVINGTAPLSYSYNTALFKDSIVNALTAVRNYGDGYTYQTVIQFCDSPATTSAITYKVRCGSSSGSFYLNQTNGNIGMFGGACHSTITLTEIKAS